jgi:hypothetical protein
MDSEEQSIDKRLGYFEAVVNMEDAAQADLLQRIKELTGSIHQARGDWNTPSTQRNWNAGPDPKQKTPKKSLEYFT